jgi:RHS repeat-associated protein
VSRLLSASLYDGATGGGNLKQQSYTFDTFGNLTAIAGTVGRNIPTSTATNRLNASGTAYDAAGNLTNWNGAVYQYDRFNQMVHMTSGGEGWIYAYTADDERLWSYDLPRNASRWTVRDLGGKVLREYLNDQGRWSVGTDYLYHDDSLLAAETQTGRRHFHLDHLGTPRLVTKASGDRASYHVYYPFGEEATAFNQDAERMKFTGHERDLASPGGAGDDLDYMHARHCSPVMGRFLSVDPALESADPFKPQGWNRYGYVRGNPLVLVDPSGEVLRFFGSNTHLRQIERIANASLHGVKLVINRQGIATLAPTTVSGSPTQGQAAMAAIFNNAISRPENVDIAVGSGQSDVLSGQYLTGTIDMGDIAAFGAGPAVSAASVLAHEVSEQTAKVAFGFPDNRSGFDRAHPFGLAAQDAVSGFVRGLPDPGSTLPRQAPYTGTSITPFTRGNQRVTVTIFWQDGNIFRINRR